MIMDETPAFIPARQLVPHDDEHAVQLLNAMAAACALLAISDGYIAVSERKKFLASVAAQPILNYFGHQAVAGQFALHEQELKKNPARGMREAFAAIRPLAARPQEAAAVVDACWAVLSADGFARRPEFHALDAIRRALGLLPPEPGALAATAHKVPMRPQEPEILPPGIARANLSAASALTQAPPSRRARQKRLCPQPCHKITAFMILNAKLECERITIKGAMASNGKLTAIFLSLLGEVACCLPAGAQEKPVSGISATQYQLRGVEDTLDASAAQRRKIEIEIETIRSDRARLTSALLETGAKVKDAEDKASDIEQKLQLLTGSEDAIRRSLDNRRGVIAEVLAALQRMGRKPPPAVLVQPEDMLSAIRTSILLGAVLPEMRAETEALSADLGEMVRLKKSIGEEREGLRLALASLSGERGRLNALVSARQGAQSDAEKALAAERARAAELGREAASLKELIARMETEVASAAKAAEEARKADAERLRLAEAEAAGITAKLANPPRDPARLAPALAFAETKGLLPLPVSGIVRKTFGVPDGFGGTEKGQSIATRAGASVLSPNDGWIAFSGPWRSYGQLLIINGGNGYYVVLAGMEKIDVAVGQFVLAGEPVASMGNGSVKTAATLAIGAAEPILYVEFRKDGAAIDPGPWWAKTANEKARG